MAFGDDDYNRDREPGLVVVQGSAYAKEMMKFEQFPSKYGPNPGNPYVKREFPKMLYRAEKFQGQIRCMASVPNVIDYPDVSSYMRMEDASTRFTKQCQRIVKDEQEMQSAKENGWRESPQEAIDYLEARENAKGNAAGERHYADRGMSDAAKAEALQAERDHFYETGEQLPAVPVKRRRGRPRKVAE